MRHRSRRIVPTGLTALAVVALLVAISTAIAKGKWTREDALNESIDNVINGVVDRKDVGNLEKGFKKDSKNPNLAAVLSGAYGLAAEESGNAALGEQAEQMAKTAAQLGPNEVAVQIAVAAVEIQEDNPSERQKGRQTLQALEKHAPKVAHYLTGKSLVLEGAEEQGVQQLQAAGIPAANQVLQKRKAMKMEFEKKAKK